MKIFETRKDLLNILPKNMKWVELGVFLGDFSKEIYDVCLPSRLYLVDIFPNMMVSGDKDGKNIKSVDISNIPESLNKYFNDKNVYVIKSKTIDFMNQKIENHEFVDIVYIDADHSYNSVKNDLELSYKLVRNGGFICGHDYTNDMFPGVVKAVDEFCRENNLKIDYLTKDGCPSFCIKKI